MLIFNHPQSTIRLFNPFYIAKKKLFQPEKANTAQKFPQEVEGNNKQKHNYNISKKKKNPTPAAKKQEKIQPSPFSHNLHACNGSKI